MNEFKRRGIDKIYADPKAPSETFVFDEKVADVFEDMIDRSVPGYRDVIAMIGVLAEQYVQNNSRCFDLGCSLGAATFSVLQTTGGKDYELLAVDNSEAMVERCLENLKRYKSGDRVDVKCEDIRDTKVTEASFVILNFTLQFIPTQERQLFLNKIVEGMLPGGCLVLSEKIAFSSAEQQAFQEGLHINFKKMHGYSDLEISQKRTALENVLIPETLEVHRARLEQAGFKKVYTWFQCFNFASMMAIK